MIYLKEFELPSLARRELFTNDIKLRVYNTAYPFNVFELTEVPMFEFEPITILCGGNGCGKSTVLHVIAQALGLRRGAPYNRSSFFDDYVALCHHAERGDPEAITQGRIITSDDVFDYLLDIRHMNDGTDRQRSELFEEYKRVKKVGYTFRTMADYDDLKRFTDAQRSTKSAYVRNRLAENVPERSNGESALMFFTEAIRENALYLLDEPENSLSAQRQQELVQFLTDSARFYGCQFIIATHSPFILACPGAKIYCLDDEPHVVKSWTQLPSVKVWYEFFMEHQGEFEE